MEVFTTKTVMKTSRNVKESSKSEETEIKRIPPGIPEPVVEQDEQRGPEGGEGEEGGGRGTEEEEEDREVVQTREQEENSVREQAGC